MDVFFNTQIYRSDLYTYVLQIFFRQVDEFHHWSSYKDK